MSGTVTEAFRSGSMVAVAHCSRPRLKTRSWADSDSEIDAAATGAVMTKSRPEIILEGSDDGVSWQPYEFRYKPGKLDRTPPFLLGHMPRLDWMMWFASLGSCACNPWFVQFQDGLLR